MRLPFFKTARLKLGIKLALMFTLLAMLPLFVTNILFFSLYGKAGSDEITFLLALLAINFVFILLIGSILSHHFASQIQKILTATIYFEKGDFSHRLDLKTGDELEGISQNLNTVGANLNQIFQKVAQERTALSLQSDKIVAVLSSIDDAVIAVDLKRNITIFNKAAQELTNLRETEALGKSIGEVIKVFDNKDELSPLTYCPISTNPLGGVLFGKNDLKVIGNHREEFVNLVARQIEGGAKANLGCILTLRNITHEKQLEAMKMDFVSMAAHELRTPLTSIKGYVSVFIEENQKNFNKDQLMFMERIMASTQQLLSLVENLLNVSRVERGAMSVFRQPLEWTGTVQHLVQDLTNRAREKNITLEYLSSNLKEIIVEADKLKISEVVNNLITNAINYTPSGGTIKVWIETTNQEAITHVQDNGVGIPREALPYLFTKFFRAHNKLEMTRGTGLGLYISKAIVELHHGKIWVESEVGKGSTFSFSIPLSQHRL